MSAASARVATSARPGFAAAASASRRCSAGSAASCAPSHAGARLVLAPHPAAPGRADAFWIVAGRIADWGPLPADPDEVAARTADAVAAAPPAALGGWLPADELDELRIVGSWLAGHDRTHVLELDGRDDAASPRLSAAARGERQLRLGREVGSRPRGGIRGVTDKRPVRTGIGTPLVVSS